MTKPLAFIFYIQLLPGSQLANRLIELGYRVQVVELEALGKLVEAEKPILMMAEVSPKTQKEVCAAVAGIKANPKTRHIPILAFSNKLDKTLQEALLAAGVSLLAGNAAILEQLPSLLDQLLEVMD